MTTESANNQGDVTPKAEGEATAGTGTPVAQPVDAQAPTGQEGQPNGDQQPESVESWKFDIPEEMPIHQAMLDGFLGVAKELQLPKAQADKLVGFYVQQQQAEQEQLTQILSGWQDDLKNDPKIGGDKFDETIAAVRQTMDKLNEQIPGLKEAFSSPLIGNNPQVIRLFHLIHSRIGDDNNPPPADTAPGGQLPPERRMFPGMN